MDGRIMSLVNVVTGDVNSTVAMKCYRELNNGNNILHLSCFPASKWNSTMQINLNYNGRCPRKPMIHTSGGLKWGIWCLTVGRWLVVSVNTTWQCRIKETSDFNNFAGLFPLTTFISHSIPNHLSDSWRTPISRLHLQPWIMPQLSIPLIFLGARLATHGNLHSYNFFRLVMKCYTEEQCELQNPSQWWAVMKFIRFSTFCFWWWFGAEIDLIKIINGYLRL